MRHIFSSCLSKRWAPLSLILPICVCVCAACDRSHCNISDHFRISAFSIMWARVFLESDKFNDTGYTDKIGYLCEPHDGLAKCGRRQRLLHMSCPKRIFIGHFGKAKSWRKSYFCILRWPGEHCRTSRLLDCAMRMALSIASSHYSHIPFRSISMTENLLKN